MTTDRVQSIRERLEAATPRENSLRGENIFFKLHLAGVCARGHERTPETRNKSGSCKICRAEDYKAGRHMASAPILLGTLREMRPCIYCGDKFPAFNPRSMYCSTACWNGVRRDRRRIKEPVR